ncbi:MAG: phospholipase D-like domain-containing protein [Chloroflexi bacterium]|nr:phospholipase D-like domain-containing protein [Chloroflexota bacterium]
MESNRGFWRKTERGIRTLFLGFFPLIMLLALVLHGAEHGASAVPASSPDVAPTGPPLDYREARFNFGRGFIGDGWRLFFNEPDASAARESYEGGIEMALVEAIQETQDQLDVAAFEMNSEPIVEAILEAHQRGVAVRIVTDDDHGLNDKADEALRSFQAAGVPLVDDGRSGLMHNKFMILDGRAVWTGSWNYTVNGTYRNNNNVLVLENEWAAAAFQAEFDEMFERGEFGTRSTDDGIVRFSHADGEVSLIFASEADEVSGLRAEIARAARSIHIMTFVFSLEELAEAILLQAAQADLVLRGVFEKRNSTASWSQMPALHCAGAEIRQDGNRYTLHHKVIIIDEHTVITGSFNFSNSAAKRNDENIVIIRNADIARLYLDEWRHIWDSASELDPAEVNCD